jgi:penicillin-binding protein 2
MMVGIGQVYNTYTPLQMANYVATIANSGSRYRPQLLKKVINPDGEVVLETSPEILDNIDLSPETLDLIKQGMLGVTEPGGTAGGVFAGFPIKVAGKTGTADNPHGDDHAWFVGYAPAENPSIAFAVIIEQGGFGGASAGALARKVLAEYFQVDIQQTTVR